LKTPSKRKKKKRKRKKSPNNTLPKCVWASGRGKLTNRPKEQQKGLNNDQLT